MVTMSYFDRFITRLNVRQISLFLLNLQFEIFKHDTSAKSHIKNKRASFDYEFIDKYVAGMVLLGTEIKSIRLSKVSMNDAYCHFIAGELYIKNLSISEYDFGTCNNHEVRRERKLLMSRRELTSWNGN